MPHWLSYLTLIPGLVIAIKLAFGWEEQNLESMGLSGMLVLVGIALMGISQAETAKSSERKEEACQTAISFAFSRLMASALITLCMLGFSLYVIYQKEEIDAATGLFWFSLPFFFILLTIKYYNVWNINRFLYRTGQLTEGKILSSVRQIHHKKGNIYLSVDYHFIVPEKGEFTGTATCPYSPYSQFEEGESAQVLYDPEKPQRNLLLNAWHGKGLHSRREYDKKLAHPDEGSA